MAFATKQLPHHPDAIAPDGSAVRILLALGRGSAAHFELPPGATSVAVRHRTVEEIWFVVGGAGEMWRRDHDGEAVVALTPGTCLTIPLGTMFQFRCTSTDPLAAFGITMPPWPGVGEAVASAGRWPATARSGPGLAAE